MDCNDTIKFTIIGAGVIGLAIAEKISRTFAGDTDVLVVEKERSFGKGTSSRNSEVIHSGIYYPTGSLKHRLCIRGRRLLYQYCDEKHIRYNKCGKLIIATGENELDELERLYKLSQDNGVENVERLNREQALELEPDINVTAALFSQETGIFDTHAFMKSLEEAVHKNNGIILYGAEVSSIHYDNHQYHLGLRDGTRFTSDHVINAAGLLATKLSGLLRLEPVRLYPCKGDYFSYGGRHRCRHLIYPVPNKKLTGLGVHATIDLGGRLKFGPDAEYVDDISHYAVDPVKRDEFYNAASKIFRYIEYDHLSPDMAGIRPKIQGPEDREVKDFYIKEESERGFPGFINLLGIESPGLTASLAIAEFISDMIRR